MSITIDSLHYYPLKSGMGVKDYSAEIVEDGIKGDRKYMLIHAEGPKQGHMISQRDKGAERLAQLLLEPDESDPYFMSRLTDYFKEKTEGEPSRPYHPYHPYLSGRRAQITQAIIHGQTVKAYDEGNVAATIFSNILSMPCRLVRSEIVTGRRIDAAFASSYDDIIQNFADGFPLLVTNQASLDALNAEIAPEHQVEMSRFRPNIVLKGLAPFEEDTIQQIQIGNSMKIDFVKPCTRCKLVTVDQNTGEVTSKEPLQTLAKLRRGKAGGLQGVFFGQNAVPLQNGTIHAGSEVKITRHKAMHPAVHQATLKYTPY